MYISLNFLLAVGGGYLLYKLFFGESTYVPSTPQPKRVTVIQADGQWVSMLESEWKAKQK